MKMISAKTISAWKILFCALGCFLIFSYLQVKREPLLSSYEGKSVQEILQMMPKRDRQRLEHFFLKAVNWDALGYVLFGDKPMAYLEGIDKKLNPFRSFGSFLYAISPRRIQAENGFKTWKKYAHLFPMDRFVFLYEENENDLNALFINKESFIDKVKECEEDFKKILQREVTGEQLLAEASSFSLLAEVLQNHDVLLGILFGFGRDNAYAFYQRASISSSEQKREFQRKFHFKDPWENEFKDLNEKLDRVSWISGYLTGAHLKNLDLMMYPGFYALVDHPETKQLKANFIRTRNEMIAYYKDKDFLEATLKALTSLKAKK
ncbi:MAG: hypothetical protein K2P51_02925 [Rhabdochlamydiaceae bacterium]|nr:hypothetical protein [Rhabdochlamydiaceae bacterium]